MNIKYSGENTSKALIRKFFEFLAKKVSTVNNVKPDADGNVTLTAENVGAKPASYKAPVDSVNGKTGAVQLTASDVSARPSSWMPTASQVGARPNTWTPSASDVGALPSSGTAADAAKLGGKTWAERLLDIYPVGSIYMSVRSTSPASMFGGTWEQLKDRFLLGAGDTYANGATGGSATHTLSVDEMPAHSHTTLIDIAYTMGKVDGGYTYAISNSGSFPTGTSGGNQPHNNLPPYLAVYMWKRVA